ncbi:sensor histidine kinase [Nonomuraea sp. SYSU D8015]|uniref:sensor histidine kinase n=1 Tax=Nonomuraea sp. SYSU D8015 TaxID=2593644 RepID=UPI00166117B1|nr:HAMP domain-containing sensor histidine kinase [Nonomuraea sp. SYSU D8015]
MKHLPLRIRLTAVFTLAMTAVLIGAGYATLTHFREAQDESIHLTAQAAYEDLRGELLTVLPAILLASTSGAYLLAAAALRPVERLRAQAAAVTEDTPDPRLEVPPSRDEIARLAHTLNTMLVRLHAALERERRFVADASHELRTPLSLLKTELDLATRRPRDAGELTAALTSARQETDRLVGIAEDLLLLARADQAPAHTTAVTPLSPLLARVAARHHEVSLHCPPGLQIQMDPVRLERAVTNLVHNALHHGTPPIEILTQTTGGQITIHVRDRGPGFPETFRPHAFERFTRADPARATGGTGLGLALVAAIARNAGGHYGASNRRRWRRRVAHPATAP